MHRDQRLPRSALLSSSLKSIKVIYTAGRVLNIREIVNFLVG